MWDYADRDLEYEIPVLTVALFRSRNSFSCAFQHMFSGNLPSTFFFGRWA